MTTLAPANTETYERLQATLRELFQLDQADLDFGIYRILNQRRTQVEDFLENKMPARVRAALQSNAAAGHDDLRKKLQQLETTLRGAGVDPDTNAKVLDLRKQLGTGASLEAMENEVFSLLTNFFKRYYQQGDFISQRRYKKDVYAIPYEGEEVKLHWANHDQYYIKTGEYFKQYRFAVPGGKWVNFELKEASTEQANNKAAAGKERRFRLYEEDFVQVDGDTLRIFFVYEALDKKTSQDELLKEAFERLAPALPAAYQAELLRPMPTDKQRDRTLLHKRLKDYTARNTFDYFIHKDLGGFLRREMDFFIKNEVLLLDDLHLDDPQKYAAQLRTVKALKAAATPVIDFLEQLENFQKKLWLKKKFVVDTNWCITLDRVPKELYAEIAANAAQREEWKKLFHLPDIAGYSEPLTVTFLEANPYLVLDTQFFAEAKKEGTSVRERIIASIENLDEQTEGLLIHSENFQALKLIRERYKHTVDVIAVDPPYNTGGDDFPYKDDFCDSSWLSMIVDRLVLSEQCLNRKGVMFVNIGDKNAEHHASPLLVAILDQHLQADYVGQLVWQTAKGGGNATTFVRGHEYVLCYSPDPDVNLTRKGEKGAKHAKAAEGGSERYVKQNDKWYWLNDDVERKVFGKYEKGTERRCLYEELEEYKGVEKKLEIDRLISEGAYALRPNPDGTGHYICRLEDVTTMRMSLYSILQGELSEKGRSEVESMGMTLAQDVFPKPKGLIGALVDATDNRNATVLDSFGGTATTAHAVIELNREDGGHRKYVLAEMGEYFEAHTKKRVLKAVYSNDWTNGKPGTRKGISHCFKYIRLESYEDVLNNLQVHKASAELFGNGKDGFAEDHLLHYALDVESRESLLNVRSFADPFNYRLRITRHNEMQEERIDLVETFNYLIGLVVHHRQWMSGFHVVTGALLSGEKVLIIWRNTTEKDNAALEAFFKKRQYNPRDTEFDLIYVNGDNTLENLRTEPEHWKVRLIEEEFLKRMWEGKDV